PLGRRRYLAPINRLMRVSHIYSAASVLVSMLFFAVTGLYLNHPEFGEGSVATSQRNLELPAWAMGQWDESGPPTSVVLDLLHWLDREHQVSGIDFAVEFDDLDNLLVIDLAAPDGSTLVEVFFDDSTVSVDERRLSLLATFNNLHRAKHVSGYWLYLSDFSAICMLIFCISGFWLMTVNKLRRTQASMVVFLGCGLFVFAALIVH
ncbi:MAG: PepSY-associated TM helix domain-containing protein, partial [Pseudomonadota bacterium]